MTDVRDPNALFSLNPRARPHLMRIGTEGEPLALVDDFFEDPGGIVEFAAEQAPFGPAGAGYPGVRAAVPEFLNHVLIYALHPLFEQVFDIGQDAQMRLETAFSMVTHRADKLWTAQLLPHYDNLDAGALAIVLYLCDPKWGGTAFYRHRSTGFETVTPSRAGLYNERLAEELARTPLPEKFPDAGNPLFEH